VNQLESEGVGVLEPCDMAPAESAAPAQLAAPAPGDPAAPIEPAAKPATLPVDVKPDVLTSQDWCLNLSMQVKQT